MIANIQTAFEHACFISYKRPPIGAPERHFYRQFVLALRDRLEYYLPTNIRSFLDEDADPGASYPIELSRKLCKSVCFVAVLTPEYLDSSWCQAEWRAMIDFEAKRLVREQFGLVIPVVLRGELKQWETLYNRKPVDLRVDVPGQLSNIKRSIAIKQIADIVAKFVETIGSAGADCQNFRLSVDLTSDVLRPSASFTDPNPLAG